VRRQRTSALRRPTSALALVATAVALAAGCDGTDRATSRAVASPKSRAALVIEPSILRIGDVATAELVVVTPPDHRVLPFAPPDVPGVWLLELTPEPPEIREQRWVHRTRIRVRPRDIGVYSWPDSQVVVEKTDGVRLTLEVPGRRFEVTSVLPQHADRTAPFGLRGPPGGSGGSGFWLGALAGAGATALALLLLIAGRRLGRSTNGEAPDAHEVATEADRDLWSWAERELAAARAGAGDPNLAANAGAKLLRRFMARRFDVATEAQTTQELAATEPLLGARTLWPEFVRILGRLDDQRFRPAEGLDEVATREAVTRILGALARFLIESEPPGGRAGRR
jgi:hypothetical protein